MKTTPIDPFPIFSGLKQSEAGKRQREDEGRQEKQREENEERDFYENDTD